jgi:hypothetical protein
MSKYTQPTGNGMQWEMDWNDYVKHGFDEKKAKLVPNVAETDAIARVKKIVAKRDEKK